MDAVDINMAYREVASPEELEEWDFDERQARIPTFPKSWNRDMFLMIPDAMGRSEWEQRSPALGLNDDTIQDLEQHATNPLLLDVQRRILFQYLRHEMLQQLIGCSGAGSVHDLCEILRAELALGVPTPAPAWYVFSTITMGPRKIGYSACNHRGCLVTESLTSARAFKKCSFCKVPWYCSAACQSSDWAIRHKHICEEAKRSREQLKKVGEFFQKVSDAGHAGDAPAWNSMESLAAAFESPEVASRMMQRTADLKKEKHRASASGANSVDPNWWQNDRHSTSSSQRSFQQASVVIVPGLFALKGRYCVLCLFLLLFVILFRFSP
jgi:hypothetical protein